MEQLRGGALGAMVRTKKVLTRAEAKAMALREGVEAEEEEEEEEEEEDEDEGDEDGEDDDEVDGEESVDGEEEEQQQPDPEAVSEIVQFMREMAGDPGRRKMADKAGDIAVKFCHTLDAVKAPGTAKKVLARAFPSGANVFGHLKELASQAWAFVAWEVVRCAFIKACRRQFPSAGTSSLCSPSCTMLCESKPPFWSG